MLRGLSLKAAVLSAFLAAHGAAWAWSVPSWDARLTAPGALLARSGHVQGMCVSEKALYFVMHNQIVKTDWMGCPLKSVEAPKHSGDVCMWNGKLYVAFCEPGGSKAANKGRIMVYDEELNFLKETRFARPADGITCMDGVLYVGLGPGGTKEAPYRGCWYGKFDAETLAPLCEPFRIDHGYDCCAGVQNMATDGKFLYVSYYTPEETACTPDFIKFDRDFNVLGAHRFGYRQGLDVVPCGTPGSVRFIYVTTVNWMGQPKSGDWPPVQALWQFAEMKDGSIRDITRHNIYRKPWKRDGELPWDILTGQDGARLEMDIGPVLKGGRMAAGADATGNLLTNGDFEKGFADWRESGSLWRVEDGAGYDGSKGLVWECDDATKYRYPAQYVKLEAGCAYRISALVKVDELKGVGEPSVGFEWFDTNGTWVAGAYAKPVDDNGALKDGWVRYEGVTRTMKSSDARGGVLCLLRKGATGKVRFDNVTFERVPVNPVSFLCTSAYRDSAADGNLRVLASINADTKLHVATLTVGLANGDVRTLKPVQFLNDAATFTLPVSELAMGKQKLAFRLASRKDGRIVGTAEIAFERTAADGSGRAGARPSRRRVSFDSQRRMLLDGKKFFPLGHYTGAMSVEDMEQYKRGPYNFAIQYSGINTAQLDRWQKAGVFVASDVRGLIYGYPYATKIGIKTPEDTKAALRGRFEAVGSHPALVMWYLNDEAPVSMVPNTTVAHEFLHEIDPERATITCLCHPNTVRDFLPSYDVMAHDCYPIGNDKGPRSDLERVTRQMRTVEEELAAMRPLWFIPQTFDWRWCYAKERWPKCNQQYLRMPTRAEMANMTWQGIACGANGIVSYSYSTIRRNAKGEEFEKAWGDTCDVAFEVKKMEEVLLSDDITADFAKACAALPKYLPVRFYRHEGRVWMLAVNATREPMKAKLPLGSRYQDFTTKLGGGVTLLPDGSALDLDFPPMGYAFVSFKNQ